jgi:hypothetical protein
MNVVLWILQIALAFLYFSGGLYKIFQGGAVVEQTGMLTPAAWAVLGLVEVAGAILLVIPTGGKRSPMVTPLAAVALATETLGLAAFYAQYSLELTVANPLVWAATMGLLAAVVAFGRYVRPLRLATN